MHSRSEAASICTFGFGTRFSPVSATDEGPEQRFHVRELIDSVADGSVVPIRGLVFARIGYGAFVWSASCRMWFWSEWARRFLMTTRRFDGAAGGR